ncbi:PEP-CTERM sorting domain-containing protein [Agarivorans sp. TSD2052]|uniref:PEP-CTERM sorting domain-containing protein n=1 Tax=Agarivorans sp. TSD2052 TaxID=2937286 RepID=UPI0020101784|nr:PEP-CTERM sorting domain-containing protein [Agarivorans sp. TSD2052]UPW18652.1 PEP-CTERM sorting domain-containing protein [Agarivorans sp. TSD2052]
MSTLNDHKLLTLAAFSLSMFSPIANAGVIDITLGNGSSGLVDDGIYSFAPTIFPIQSGQPAPFNEIFGHEILTNPANTSWSFNYSAIVDTIVSATFSFGIWDIDSASSGSQLDAFSLDGNNLTSELDTLFEAGGGSVDLQYDVYSFSLDNSFFADLSDGVFTANLDIGGSGLLTNGITGAISESANNNYGLIYSNLIINTEETSPPPPNQVPEPSSIFLFIAAMLGLKRHISK